MNVQPVIILGTGGTCLDILEAMLAHNRSAGPDEPRFECRGFLDDDPALQGGEVAGLPVLGTLAEAGRFADCSFVNGIGSPQSFRHKAAIIAKTGLPPERFVTVRHPLADVSPSARLGPGCVVLAGAAVGAEAVLGCHVVLLQNAVVSHHCEVGDGCCLASGAVLAGRVRVGQLAYIGANASVRGGLHIGSGALVGMGSVVLTDVPPHVVVAGNPARQLRTFES
ncbi:MAG: sugar O-acyltransferase [Verrucomicrobia bacterium]|nr:MAG: sugar O-acyltransferase [Verrucomicrobiota bacterium]